MTQDLIAALLVVVAAVYSIWYVLPASARRQLGRIHRLLGRPPRCGSCSDCGKCASPSLVKPNVSPAKSVQPITWHRKV